MDHENGTSHEMTEKRYHATAPSFNSHHIHIVGDQDCFKAILEQHIGSISMAPLSRTVLDDDQLNGSCAGRSLCRLEYLQNLHLFCDTN